MSLTRCRNTMCKTSCTCQASTRALKSWFGTSVVFCSTSPVFGLVLCVRNQSKMLDRSYLNYHTVNITIVKKMKGTQETYVKPSDATTGSRYISMLKVLQFSVKIKNWSLAACSERTGRSCHREVLQSHQTCFA